ncbi:MAG: hypothetical protein OIF55_12295 [Amphritea sp.]|nr:hypothetical protein [Amphritea sp.]
MESVLKHTLSILNGTLVLGTLLASLLLLSGYSYNLGSFGAFGLGADAIPLNFSDSVAASFYMGVFLIAQVWSNSYIIWLAVLSPVIAILFLFTVVVICRQTGLGDRLVAWDERREELLQEGGFSWLRVGSELYAVYQKVGSWAITLVFVVTLPMLIVVAPLKYGQEQGEKLVDAFGDTPENCQGLLNSQKTCYSLSNQESGKIITRGALVIGTNDHIALYNGELTQVYRRSDNLVLQINKPANDKQ